MAHPYVTYVCQPTRRYKVGCSYGLVDRSTAYKGDSVGESAPRPFGALSSLVLLPVAGFLSTVPGQRGK